MSIARAFTKRNKRSVDQTPVQRGTSVRYAPGTINRSLISLPTELISTTNVQALTAPDIRNISASSAASTNSGNESDFSTIDRSFLNNTGSDTSSIDSAGPATPITPSTDEVKSFFDPKQPTPILPSVASPPVLDTPTLPQRSPSHSKKAHVELSRKRSIQRLSPPPNTIVKPAVRNSNDFFAKPTDPSHPFGRELAQVSEMAEQFGAAARLLDEEEQDILDKGLCKFAVEEYLDEIAGLYGGIFEDKLGPLSKPWI